MPAKKEGKKVAVKEVKKESKEATIEKTTKKTEKAVKETKEAAKTTKKTEAKAKKSETSKTSKIAKQTTKQPATKTVEKPKKETAKKEPVKKTVTKKATSKKGTVKKTPAKKTTPKKITKAQKVAQYEKFSVETCIEMARAMGVDLGYDAYAQLLLDSEDIKSIVKNITETYNLKESKVTFEEEGYDIDLLPVLVEKVSQSVDLKASDFTTLASDVTTYTKATLTDDNSKNNDIYNAMFDVTKKVLMIAQRKDIHNTSDMKPFVDADIKGYVINYMDVAYQVLRTWQYDDVKYYENFIYAVVSQFTDLYEDLSNRAMMDVADLYILHGDYGLGDANYGYILRENQIKDYIYYRFANVYETIDRDKARAIASEALQFVDGRFTYHDNIVKILED